MGIIKTVSDVMLKGRICKLDIGVTITLSELHISSCVTANRLFEDALAKLRLLDIEFLFTGDQGHDGQYNNNV
ncbi:hypothetical protein T4E_6947 [Trichinella pseudospiralis]|uniref:Uncharacterized protein n=1 Tax=Trichinella pseudospiralis TaxID=6337 RepID=A0A0V0XJS6_TRIPS|nr:hypothetical protein T4E_6947 [Trichinella pseudospiralis]